MAAPISYNNTTTQLPEVPRTMPPPERAEVLKHFAHGGIRFVMGKHDTATSLFKTLYPTGRHYARSSRKRAGAARRTCRRS